jgi:hypothetical protein
MDDPTRPATTWRTTPSPVRPPDASLTTAHDAFVPIGEDGALALAEDYYYLFTAE